MLKIKDSVINKNDCLIGHKTIYVNIGGNKICRVVIPIYNIELLPNDFILRPETLIQIGLADLLQENEELRKQLKKQNEVIEKAIDFIKNGDLLYLVNKNSVVYADNIEVKAVVDRLNNLLLILEDKEVE